MPKYKTMMRQYHKHMCLAQECMQIYDAKKLHDLGELEQDMATGLTESGEKVNMKTIKTSLVDMCQNAQIGVVEKLRLLMIYIIAQGPMQESTRRELMSGISMRLQNAIRQLEKLGVDISALTKNKAKHSKARLSEFEKRNKTIPLALMRYIPFIHQVINSFLSSDLSEEEYRYIGEPPSASSARQSVAKAAKKQTKSNWRGNKKEQKQEQEIVTEDPRTRYMVYMLGGVTFSELRSAYELSDANPNVNLFMGSSSTINAAQFIRGLADLDDDEDLEAANSDSKKPSRQTRDDDDDDDKQEAKKEEQEVGKKKKKKKGEEKKKKPRKKRDDSDDDSDDEGRNKTNENFKKIDVKIT